MKYISIFPINIVKPNNNNSPQKSTPPKTTLISYVSPFWLQLCYFIVVTVFGYLTLKFTKPRTEHVLDDFDLFFTSASATTVASLSTVEMEVFSNAQLIIMTILIFLGGEIFISLLVLQLKRSKLNSSSLHKNRDNSSTIDQELVNIELGAIANNNTLNYYNETVLHQNSIKSLGFIITGYIFAVHVLGIFLVSVYINLTSTAKTVLDNKGLVLETFSIFTTVSTFANCGFVPTNENMVVFRNNPGLLLILIPLGLIGETLYPLCLRIIVRVLGKFTQKKEYTFMLENCEEMGYSHLMSSMETWLLVGTVLGFLGLQFAMFCVMEWGSGVMEGMNTYEKIVGSLFQTANVRHAGESVFDLSLVSSAILVIFIVMMYFPSYTSYLPVGYQQEQKLTKTYEKNSKQNNLVQNIIFSHLSYLTIFVIIICITERKKMKEDPLNFNLLNIIFEVISGYGSVGFSTGYSCKRKMIHDEICIDKSFGLAGKFSKGGKFTIILVMFYGRFKSFNMHGGKAWRLS